jgi:hypothetical protein
LVSNVGLRDSVGFLDPLPSPQHTESKPISPETW